MKTQKAQNVSPQDVERKRPGRGQIAMPLLKEHAPYAFMEAGEDFDTLAEAWGTKRWKALAAVIAGLCIAQGIPPRPRAGRPAAVVPIRRAA